MSTGLAHRQRMSLPEIGELIGRLEHNQALALGQLRPDLSDADRVVAPYRNDDGRPSRRPTCREIPQTSAVCRW